MSELVEMVKHDRIGEIVINSPPVNALSNELLNQLNKAISDAKDAPDLKVILLRSAVPNICQISITFNSYV